MPRLLSPKFAHSSTLSVALIHARNDGVKMDKDNDAINLTDANLSNLKFDHLCLIFLYKVSRLYK